MNKVFEVIARGGDPSIICRSKSVASVRAKFIAMKTKISAQPE